MKRATMGRIDRGRDVAGENDPLTFGGGVNDRDRGE
jgi:hypothetical protein